jgi:recombination protein RecR
MNSTIGYFCHENVKISILFKPALKLNYSSRLLENAVNELARLPGIGRKTALRLALHLIRQDAQNVEAFSKSITAMRNDIKRCKNCNNISDNDLCDICANQKRDHSITCVVQDIRDVMAIENTGQYNGVYYVLGGIISPMDGIGPEDLAIEPLIVKAAEGLIKEIIFALPTTIEGDTTNYYLSKRLAGLPILLSAIARGIAIGDDIEYADEITLGRSIVNRIPFSTKT